MNDSERVVLMTDDDPVGAMQLVSVVSFGQRAAALSGVGAVRDRAEAGPFDGPSMLTWPWPDHPTCSSVTL